MTITTENNNSPGEPHDKNNENKLLTEGQQVLLTAAALDELEAGSADQTAAAALLADDEHNAAKRLNSETKQLAAAARQAATRESDSLASDPRRQDLRRAVLAAVASQGQPASPTQPKGRSRLIGWVALGSLATAAAVMLAVMPRTALLMGSANRDREIAMRDSQVLKKERVLAPSATPLESVMPLADVEEALAETAAPPVDGLARMAGNQLGSPELAKRRFAKQKAAAPTASSAPTPSSALTAPVASSASAHPPANALATVIPETAAGKAIADERSRLSQSPAVKGKLQAGRQESRLRYAAPGAEEAEDMASGILVKELPPRPQPGRETYATITENPLRDPLNKPLSTFSVDVDTASYANVRRFLMSGRRPPRNAVRIEELVNYFSYDDPTPTGEDPFAVSLEAAASPWHADRLVVRIGLKARDIDRRERPAGNLVFLVDVSGSMSAANKLPLVKQSLKLLVNELGASDRISLVTYAGQAALRLPPTPGDDKTTVLEAIDELASAGSTHGSAGIEMAYNLAAENFVEGGVNRVLLATDGDLNVGITSDAALEALIREKAKGGVFLTVLGFGEGNLQDAKMERIADKGNGLYAYIDGLREARKVLVEQLTGSTITVAKDVKLQVEFNPATVAGYRLIGYENRLLAAQDFRDDTKDAGEIGAGHSLTALYEIVPRGVAPGRGAEPLKYQQQPEPLVALTDDNGEPSSDLLTVKLRWKLPEGSTSQLAEFPLADAGESFDGASADLRFAAAVASFGMLLRGSDEAGLVTWQRVTDMAAGSLGKDAGGYRAEFIDLARRASGG